MSQDWNAAWRQQVLPTLAQQPWDLIVIGGGISGAGILREAARRGWRCLLLEQRDFAWGTSSRSSKMVHGGLRYIAKGQWRLTRDSVHERQRLLDEAPGLVEPMSFMMPHYRGGFPGPRVFGGLLTVYDALAGRRNHHFHDAQQLRYLAPGLKEDRLLGGTCFVDALTDDARLVMRVLAEARADGALALNGMRVEQLLREDGRVCGVQVADSEGGEPMQLRCGALAVATGAWAERLRPRDAPSQLRPLRGSHLLLPGWRLPVAQAFTFLHARDRRPVFVFPWEGATVVGTRTSITRTIWTRARASAAKNSSTCWPPVPSSFPRPRWWRTMCCRPGRGCVRWWAVPMASRRASRPMKPASMCCGSNLAA